MATILAGCALRPEEYFQLRWTENIRDGAIEIHTGKGTGTWRAEVLAIRLDQVDQHDALIRLYDTKKHAEGRWLPIYGEMGQAIAAQVEATERDHPDCPWLIHRNGQQVIEMRPGTAGWIITAVFAGAPIIGGCLEFSGR